MGNAASKLLMLGIDSCIVMQGVAVALPVYFATQRLVDNLSLCYEMG